MPEAVNELWKRVAPYLDRALELNASELAQWLAALDNTEPELAAALRELLALHDANCASSFMERTLAGPAPLIGERIGPYTIVELLGHGGMGSVWRGRRSDGQFEGQAAIKILEHQAPGPDAVDRVRHEASLLARLSDPHIARLFDTGVRESGQPYLILEYIEGVHIDRYCQEQKLPLTQRLRLFCDVLDAVAHAHAQLIVHRDIKPSNVLVTPGGLVKLLDFGLAVIQPKELLRRQSALFLDPQGLTPAYAAPEQIRGEPVSTAADVYSLGVLLHVLVTGSHPRAAPGPDATQRTYTTLVVPASQRLCDAADRRRVRGDLDVIIAHALEDDPASRYSSAAAFAADIRAYLGKRPVRARPATRIYVAKRFVQRHRAGTLGVLLTGILLIAASVATTLQMLDARQQRDFAFRQLGTAEAVNELNEYVIYDAAPPGRPITAVDILARAEHVLERQHLTDANRVMLMATVGWEYDAQGYKALGLKLLNNVYGLSRQVSDPVARATAACNLASALADQTPSPRSSQLIEEGLRELPQGPEYALSRTECLRRGMYVAVGLGDSDLAVQRIEAASEVLKQVPFAHDLVDLHVSEELPQTLTEAGRYRESIAAFAKGWPRLVALGRDDTVGANHWLNNWAFALIAAGKPLDAEPLERRALELAQRASPAEESTPASASGNLGNYAQILFELGHVQEAESYAERAYHGSKAINNIRWLAHTQLRLARIYRWHHDLPRAAHMVGEAEVSMRQIFPPGHYEFATLAAERALEASDGGAAGPALTSINAAIQICEQPGQHGKAGAQLLPGLLAQRAMIELAAVAYPAAEADARQAVRLLGVDAPPGDYSTFGGHAHLALARALSAQGKTAEAREHAQEAARQLEKSVGPDHPDTRAARELSAAPAPTGGLQ